ncbi:uncharacterized protein EDB91DRAFT_61120 [Suillus paluster]|uniref:uncharacterized protein n=1 Tax=Suillus paluster TaxID=48578 RepID=UPI001B85E821|nr:uncharacterized protein EDB91DRAFT_61120 [Suillus paluster]KAG1726253.1 hypothetical protein EDB91DRAFT_61120 [Suillus paluster]
MKPVIQSGPILPPTEEQFSQARVAIQKMKQVFSSYGLVELQQQVVADDQQMEYDELLQQVHKITRRLDEKLPLYWITLKSDDVIRELVAIVLMVERQWERCSRGSPRFIIGLHTLKNMSIQLRKSIKVFEQRHPMITTAVASQQMGDGLTGHRPSSITAPNIPPSAQLTPRQTNQSLTPSVALSKIRPKILIPDLTGLITRCNKDPVSGGAYGNIYNCIYHGPDGDVEVAVKAIRSQFFSAKVMFYGMER